MANRNTEPILGYVAFLDHAFALKLLFTTVTLIGVYVAFSYVYGRIWEAFWILLLSTSCTSK